MSFMDLINLALSTTQVYQGDKGYKQEQALADEAIKLEKRQHGEALERERAHHRRQLDHQLAQWDLDHQLSTKLDQREQTRDEWEQKTRVVDNLNVAMTLMIGCLVAVMCEGKNESTATPLLLAPFAQRGVRQVQPATTCMYSHY